MLTASDIISQVSSVVAGLPVFIAGSLVAEETYGLTNAHDDVDIFCASPEALAVTVERFLQEDYMLNDRNERVYQRWLLDGMGSWHTNSLKLTEPLDDIKVNLVFKTIKSKPVSTLTAVLESFDFGLLATGYDMLDGKKRDLRSYLFPGVDVNGPLPLMPNKRDIWLNGFISQYNGLRQMGRYAKYVHYGYDMSAVKDDLLVGYDKIARHWEMSDLQDKVILGTIYRKAHEQIANDCIDELLTAAKVIPKLDSFDDILASME